MRTHDFCLFIFLYQDKHFVVIFVLKTEVIDAKLLLPVLSRMLGISILFLFSTFVVSLGVNRGSIQVDGYGEVCRRKMVKQFYLSNDSRSG